ncbi:MAG: PepSY domain-containing protein [Ancalomicrobiaceae bacterium]|nr:PepSY domain-containing protein [Ancalomicrobiaceae bacterium]
MWRIALAIIGLGLSASSAAASQHCRVPLADWQPREELHRVLEREQWQVVSIRLDDGCYKVKAVRPNGERLEALFDPGTLQRVTRGDHPKADDD